MDAEKLNKALYDKMAAEQERFKHGLLGQTPEEVLNHAYEYAMREDILMEMEALDLPAPQAAALLASPFPLADVYKDFRNMETGHMDILRECIEARADTMLEAKREATRAIPIYQQSGEYAREHGELDAFRTSRKANEACRDAIDAAIRDGYDGTYLTADVKGVLAEFGPERVSYVLAAIAIIDPEDEYSPLVRRLGGQVIDISPTSDQYINPMDITLNYSEDDNPLTLKSDFILSLMELIVGGKAGLEPVEKTVVDRCVHMVYREYLQDPQPEKMPVLGDLHALLCQQPEPEAQRLATALEIYVSGSLNVFNHRTNVKINSRIVCYVIKKLGKQLKKFGMQVVQDQVWGRVSENREAHKSTRLYIDEMHLLLREEQTAAYTVEIWKRFRKWGGIPTGITQNVKDLLSSREIENIFENSDFVYMLNQAGGDRQILAKQLNISPHQLGYVTNSNAGEGLLFFGSVIIPFVDHFPKDTELYGIMTTRPEDLAEQQ